MPACELRYPQRGSTCVRSRPTIFDAGKTTGDFGGSSGAPLPHQRGSGAPAENAIGAQDG